MKKYNKPETIIIKTNYEDILKATSIQNIEGDTQTGIEDNDEDDFEAGAKQNTNWNTWED